MDIVEFKNLKDAELLLVSDVHLRAPDDGRALLLLALIKAARENRVRNLVLLGDIFDFCYGRNRFYHRKFAAFGDALRSFSNSGGRVLFFEGNHEVVMQHLPWEGVEFVYEGDGTLSLSDGKRLKFAHGDLVYSNRRYRVFRRLIKSQFSQTMALITPAQWLDSYALAHSRASRGADYFRVLDQAALLRTAEAWLGEHDMGFFGHFHVPFCHQLKDGRKIVCFSSWQTPNYIALQSGVWRRATLENGNFKTEVI